MSYINDLENVKERLRVGINALLPSEEKLPVNCTLNDIANVVEHIDTYTVLNAFLNSIEIFPDHDYSIDDTEGHIKGLRPYAFYGNTALKSLNLPGVTSLTQYTIENCSNLETLVLSSLTVLAGNIIKSCGKLTKLVVPKVYLIQSDNNLMSLSSIVNLNFPSLQTFAGYNTLNGANNLKTILVGGRGSLNFTGANKPASWIALIMTSSQGVSTLSTDLSSTNVVAYVPSSLLLSYQSASNWSALNATRPFLDLESHINSLRELGVDFSWTPYANKKWDGTQLVTDSTIGEEVDE